VKPDCCPEPVAGPPVSQITLATVWSAMGDLVRGDWPQRRSLAAADRNRTLLRLDDVVAGLYLAVDGGGALRYLGQARRDGGVGARLRDHLQHPERVRVYAGVYVFEADEFRPSASLDAVEGKAADLLQLRGQVSGRRWPVPGDWLGQVGTGP
jgi:hypothetical protein